MEAESVILDLELRQFTCFIILEELKMIAFFEDFGPK